MNPQQSTLRYAFTNVVLCLILGCSLGGALSIAHARGWIGPWAWLRLAGVVERHVPAFEIRRAILLRLRPVSATPVVADLVANASAYWEAKNPEQAVKSIRSVEDVAIRFSATERLVQKFKELDPRFAATFALTLPDESKSDRLLCMVMAEWTVIDAESALGFYEGLPPEKLRPTMFLYQLDGLSQLSAERLRNFLIMLNHDLRDALLASLQIASVENESEALPLTHILALFELMKADVTSLPSTARLLSKRVALANPKLVEEWIARMPLGSARDALVAGYLDSAGFIDRISALHWASSMSDNSPLKGPTFGQHISAWLAEDRTAAQEWLSSEEGLQLCPPKNRAAWFAGWSIPVFETSKTIDP